MNTRSYTGPTWNEGSVGALRAFVKDQDRRFRRAVIFAHPEFAPVQPERIRREAPVPAPVSPAADYPKLSWRAVVAEVAEKYNVVASDIIGRSREPSVVVARNEACHRLYFEQGYSFPWIAARLGDRDHTTILNCTRKHRIAIAAYLEAKTDA